MHVCHTNRFQCPISITVSFDNLLNNSKTSTNDKYEQNVILMGYYINYQVLEDVLQKLEGAMRSKVTAEILQEAIKSADGGVYFDDFLGDGDIDIKGNAIVMSIILFQTEFYIEITFKKQKKNPLTSWTYFRSMQKTGSLRHQWPSTHL